MHSLILTVTVICLAAIFYGAYCLYRKDRTKFNPAAPRAYRNRAVIATKPEVYCAHTDRPCRDRTFIFKYMYIENQWRAYVLRAPSAGGRKWNTFLTHLCPDWGNYCEGNFHISWNTPVTSMKDMQAIAHKWGDLYLRYIETGQRF